MPLAPLWNLAFTVPLLMKATASTRIFFEVTAAIRVLLPDELAAMVANFGVTTVPPAVIWLDSTDV